MATELNKSMKYEDILLSFESEIYKSITLGYWAKAKKEMASDYDL